MRRARDGIDSSALRTTTPWRRVIAFVCLIALFAAAACVHASESKRRSFSDPEDGAFDASEWLLEHKGFLPVPIIITEPAVGYGVGLGLLFFRDSIRERAAHASGDARPAPPDVFGVGLAATENGTKGGAIGGMFTFGDNRWRYRGVAGKMDLHLDFYGIGSRLSTGDHSIGYDLNGLMSMQTLLRRMGETDHWIGARWIYLDLDSRLDAAKAFPRLPEKSFASRSSGLGVSWEYDTRDNIFTPSRGTIAAIDSVFYAPAIASDNEFQTYRARVFHYFQAAKTLVVGARLDARAARGDVPFYQLPFIDMRGIPAVRYQDRNTAVAETELRWNVTPRWAAIGFVGAARAWGTNDSFGSASTPVSKGVGGRYLVARRLGLYAGIDYAWGPEDQAFYIQIGSAWR